MDFRSAEATHAALVDGWLGRGVDRSSAVDIVWLFHTALDTLWTRAVTTLGVVTLTAISERVLAHATEQYPFLSGINPRPGPDARAQDALYERLTALPRAQLIEGVRFALVEFLTIVGTLTAEILTPDLHHALLQITVPASSPKPSTESRPLLTIVGAKDQK